VFVRFPRFSFLKFVRENSKHDEWNQSRIATNLKIADVYQAELLAKNVFEIGEKIRSPIFANIIQTNKKKKNSQTQNDVVLGRILTAS
jgi:hypothetical protein